MITQGTDQNDRRFEDIKDHLPDAISQAADAVWAARRRQMNSFIDGLERWVDSDIKHYLGGVR